MQAQYSQPPPQQQQYATPVNGMYPSDFLRNQALAFKQDGVELWRRFV
jgi:hypothetical protein